MFPPSLALAPKPMGVLTQTMGKGSKESWLLKAEITPLIGLAAQALATVARTERTHGMLSDPNRSLILGKKSN